jgi:hypothetical protein
LDWYIGKLARYQVKPEVHDITSAAAYLRRERAVTLSAAKRHNWGPVVIEHATQLNPDEVLQAALKALRPWIGNAQN